MPGARRRLTWLRGEPPSGEGQRDAAAPAGRRAALELTALGTGLVLTLALMARLGSWRLNLGTFQSLYAVAFAFFALALARARAAAIPGAGALVLVVAISARLALLPVTPTLSDDVYRYVWEGRVVAHGGDPYRTSPRDPSLAPLRDRAIYPRINHPELATIYPPLAIAGFALVARVSASVWAMKVWVVLHDLGVVLLLMAWARRRQAAGMLAVIAYAWNPLVLVEYAGGGHNDPTAMLWLVAALSMAEQRPTVSALALAAGALTKLVPLAALPFLFRRWTAGARLLAVVSIGLGLAWFFGQTRGADSGLGAYWRTWANNELGFLVLARLAGDPLRARWMMGGLVALLTAALVWRGTESAKATRLALRTGFLLSPVAHPWYLGWVLLLEPLAPSAPWLLLSLTAVLSYGVLTPPREGSTFHLSVAARAIEYGLPLALALGLAVRRRGEPQAGDRGPRARVGS